MISLVIGLGNVGRRYENTRHNLGFEVLDLVRKELKAGKKVKTATCYRSEKKLGERNIILAWPTTYMNLSGRAAFYLLETYQRPTSEMLVVVDDFNLPLGRVRFRRNGSDGGHNGLASLIEELDTSNFPRFRLGIGPVPENESSVDFVLEKFSPSEEKTAKKMIAIAAEAVIFALHNRLEEAMSKYNNPALPE
ncbi:MAG: aminoacyl-tRNA hydrolase [Candidatus Zixiibacteriota bacterium]